MLYGTSAEPRDGRFALGYSITPPFRGSKHSGVLFRAVPAYTDSDRTIEVLIPTLRSPSKMSKVRRRRGIAPKTSGRRGPELRGFRGARPFARDGMSGRRLIRSSPALSAALRASARCGSGSEPDLPALAAAERSALPQDPRFNKKRSTRIVSRARSAAPRMSMTRTREVIRRPLGGGGRRLPQARPVPRTSHIGRAHV